MRTPRPAARITPVTVDRLILRLLVATRNTPQNSRRPTQIELGAAQLVRELDGALANVGLYPRILPRPRVIQNAPTVLQATLKRRGSVSRGGSHRRQTLRRSRDELCRIGGTDRTKWQPGEDSNLERQDQNLLCCQLHHRVAEVHSARAAKPVSWLLPA